MGEATDEELMLAYAHGDEVTYASYVNALIEGRPRCNDPYTGRDARDDAPQAESYISIQFVPPLVVARAARVFGLDAARAFFWLAVAASPGPVHAFRKAVTASDRNPPDPPESSARARSCSSGTVIHHPRTAAAGDGWTVTYGRNVGPTA